MLIHLRHHRHHHGDDQRSLGRHGLGWQLGEVPERQQMRPGQQAAWLTLVQGPVQELGLGLELEFPAIPSQNLQEIGASAPASAATVSFKQ